MKTATNGHRTWMTYDDADQLRAEGAADREKWMQSHNQICDKHGRTRRVIEARLVMSRYDEGQHELLRILDAIGIPILILEQKQSAAQDVTALVPYGSYTDYLVMRTRMAGRKRACAHFGTCPEINSETTVAEFLAWKSEHTPEECAAALGMSRSTYYRALKRIEQADASKKVQFAI